MVSAAFSGLVTALAVTSLTAVLGILACSAVAGQVSVSASVSHQDRLSHRASSRSRCLSEPSRNLGGNESSGGILGLLGTQFKSLESVFEAIGPFLITSLWMSAHLLNYLRRHLLRGHTHDAPVDEISVD